MRLSQEHKNIRMSVALVFKKKVRIGDDKTVLDTYLLQVTIEKLVLAYSVALQWPYAVFYLIFFFSTWPV